MIKEEETDRRETEGRREGGRRENNIKRGGPSPGHQKCASTTVSQLANWRQHCLAAALLGGSYLAAALLAKNRNSK